MRDRFMLSVSVFVIVQRDGGAILLLRRSGTGWQDGSFSLPAGRLDGNETLAEAASRELREETSLLADADDLHLVHALHSRSGDTGGEWLGAFFVARTWQGTPCIMETTKHDDMAWHPLDALPENIVLYTRQGIEHGLRSIPFSTYGWHQVLHEAPSAPPAQTRK